MPLEMNTEIYHWLVVSPCKDKEQNLQALIENTWLFASDYSISTLHGKFFAPLTMAVRYHFPRPLKWEHGCPFPFSLLQYDLSRCLTAG